MRRTQADPVRDARPPLVVISRSHSNDPELQEYLEQLGEHQTTSIGSSLKFCLGGGRSGPALSALRADQHWDTAAGHAVAVAAGAHVHDWQGKPSTTRRVNPSLTPASGSLFIKQFMQQVDHLLHLLLGEGAVFSPLHTPVLIQHHDR